jgi:Amt family ammonium transporter
VALGGSGSDLEIGQQLGIQAIGAFATLIYSGVLTFVILKIVDVIVGLRVSDHEETEGLDLSLHGEEGFKL